MIRRLFAALFLVFAVGGPAAADPATEELLRGMVRTIDDLPDWSAQVDEIYSSGDDTMMRGLVVRHARFPISLAVRASVSRGLNGSAENGFAAEKIQVHSAILEFGSAYISVGKLIASAVRLPPGDFEFIDRSDGHVSVPRVLRYLARSEARSVEISSAVTEQLSRTKKKKQRTPNKSNIPSSPYNLGGSSKFISDRTSRFFSIELTNLKAGRLESILVGGTTSTGRPVGGAGELQFGQLQGHNIKIAAVADLVETYSRDAPESPSAWFEIADQVVVKNLRHNIRSMATLKVQLLALSGVDLRRPGKSADTQIDGKKPGTSKKVQRSGGTLLSGYSSLVGALRARAVQMEGAAYSAGTAASATLARVEAENLSSQGASLLLLEQMEIAVASPRARATSQQRRPANDHTLGFRSFRMTGIDFGSMESLQGLVDLFSTRKDFLNSPELSRLWQDAQPVYESMTWNDIYYKIGIGEPFTIRKIDAVITVISGRRMLGGTANIEKINIPIGFLTNLDPSTNELSKLGYGSFVFDNYIKFDWSENMGKYDVYYRLNGENIADLIFEISMLGVSEEILDYLTDTDIDTDPDGVMSVLSDLFVEGGQIVVTDRSIVPRTMDITAEHSNITSDQYREQTKAALPFMLWHLGNHPVRDKAIAAAQSFLDGNKRLTVSLNPPEPFSLADLVRKRESSLPELYELLGIDIQVAPAPAR